jgi:hypothetical protein
LDDLERWPWSGHSYLAGIHGAHGSEFQDKKECLRRFDSDEKKCRKAYFEFLAAGLNQSNPELAGKPGETEIIELNGSNKGWPGVIGDPEFARRAMKNHEIFRQRIHRKADYGHVLDEIATKICQKEGISFEELMRKGRLNIRTKIRAEFCSKAHFEELIPYAVIARFLGCTIASAARLSTIKKIMSDSIKIR